MDFFVFIKSDINLIGSVQDNNTVLNAQQEGHEVSFSLRLKQNDYYLKRFWSTKHKMA